jgi:hypothetical protein
MKKKLLPIYFICFICLPQISSNAQQDTTWASSGATWVYNKISMTTISKFKMTYEKDTTINNQSVKQIKTSNLTKLMPQSYFFESSFGYEYFYQSNDTVYWFKNGNFEPLYIFSDQVGTQWKVDKQSWETYYCDTTIISDSVRIKNVRDTLIDGQWLTILALESMDNRFGIGDLYRNIGAAFSPFPEMRFDSCMIIDGAVGNISDLVCYYDSIRGLVSFNPFEDCNTLLTVNTKQVTPTISSINLSPNPANDVLNIEVEIEDNWQVRIIDFSGKLVLQNHQLTSNQLNINYLPKGIYLVFLSNEKGERLTSKFLKL